MKMFGALSVRRAGLRCFRSTPNDLVLLIVGLLLTVALVARQYNGHGRDADHDEIENPLREISVRAMDRADDDDSSELRFRSRARKRAPYDERPEEEEAVSKDRLLSFATVDPRIQRIGDSRSEDCRGQNEVNMNSGKVSLIVDFTDYEFYDVRNTIDSCMRINSEDDQLVRELIAIDDGSTLDYVIEDSRRYFLSIAKATLLRHDPSSRSRGNNDGERLGTAYARIAGVGKATSEILVFLSPTVICSPGWLEPLVDAAIRHPDSIVAPHLDRIRDPVSLEYQTTSDWVVGRLSWDLAIRMREIPPPRSGVLEEGYERRRLRGSSSAAPAIPAPRVIESSAARGDVFAVGRQFFADIGSYDPLLASEALSGGSGEQVELSIRTWLCGGSVITATCSRVGVLNLHDPVKITDRSSVQYIASMWFATQQSIIVQTYNKYRPNFGIIDEVYNQTLKHVARRRSTKYCDNSENKRDIDWYLTNIAFDMVKPQADAIAFGLIRSKTGRCGRALQDSGRILLENCRPQLYGRPTGDMTFQLTRKGHLKVNDLCLTVQSNAYIVAKQCVAGETHQLWKYKPSSGQLVNVWCRYCASHVTDPDLKTPGERQIMMAQDCSADTSEGKQFTTWEFITL